MGDSLGDATSLAMLDAMTTLKRIAAKGDIDAQNLIERMASSWAAMNVGPA